MHTEGSSKQANSTIDTRTSSDAAITTPTKSSASRSKAKTPQADPSTKSVETEAEEALLMLSTPVPSRTTKPAVSSAKANHGKNTPASSAPTLKSPVKISEDESSLMSSDESFVSASEGPESSVKKSTESMIDAFDTPQDDISDLSDVEDPHFAKIMTQEAESVVVSAVSDKSESVASDAETGKEEPVKGKHIVFDSDMEAEDDEDDEAESNALAAKNTGNAGSGNSDDDDDDAPEVVDTKALALKAGAMAEDEAPAETAGKGKRGKNKKQRRSRNRKNNKHNEQEEEQPTADAEQTAASAEPTENRPKKQKSGAKEIGGKKRSDKKLAAGLQRSVNKAIESVAKLEIRSKTTMPDEIPEELRIDLAAEAATESKKRKLAQTEQAAVSSDGKLDFSVLQQFASESTVKSSLSKEKTQSDKKRNKKKKKLNKDMSSRVVSGIHVVANKRETSMSLLSSLAQSVPQKVSGFSKQKSGGARVEHTNPLIDIARQRGQPAIHFLK
ncbi:hypothetical protein FB645_000250 [Coemansia sp. IMI 203386]|nr:hypothetical protein FB645_000250 [Coemansia sp. IMI 203386]